MNTIVIFNITSGAKHSYNITVTNAAGTVNMNGGKLRYNLERILNFFDRVK